MVHGFNHSSFSFNFQQHRVGVIGDYFHFQQLFSDVVTIGGMGEEGGINNGWLYVSGVLFVL